VNTVVASGVGSGVGSAVVTSGLTRRFGRRTAVDHLDLDIAEGETFGLVGPNGAGKTTLIRILCAVLRPSGGSARVLGLDVATDADRVRPLIGYMSQAFSLYRALTVAENLRFYGALYGGVTPRRERDVCRLVDLTTGELGRQVADLPTGVRQRAALAAAVLHRPRLLFLDEPTSGVDPAGRRAFWALIKELATDGTTVIVSTHVMTEAERCDRVALMAEGRVLACGPAARLRHATGTVVAVVDAAPWQVAYAQLAARWPGTTLRGTAVHVSLPADADPRTLLADALTSVRVERIALAEPSFEDAFIWFVRNRRLEPSGT
jgi:drug efflux transport system ATP-binding protein